MKTLPDDVKPYKRTPLFTNETLPKGFLKNHTTKENVWALICVKEGKLKYTIEADETYILEPGKNGIIEPKILHHIKPLGQVVFFIEFYARDY